VTMLKRSKNTFWCSVRVCMGGSARIRVELSHHKRGRVPRAIQLSRWSPWSPWSPAGRQRGGGNSSKLSFQAFHPRVPFDFF
jgi:hypothetical protein